MYDCTGYWPVWACFVRIDQRGGWYVLRNSCRSKNCMRSPFFVRALELTVPQNSCSNFATNHVKVCAPCMNFSILCEGPDITVIVPRYGIGFGCRCAQKSCKIMHAFFTWHMLDRTVFQLNEIVHMPFWSWTRSWSYLISSCKQKIKIFMHLRAFLLLQFPYCPAPSAEVCRSSVLQ